MSCMATRKPSSARPLSRRPLTTSTADQAVFVNRTSEAQAILEAVKLGLNIWLVGTAGSGKTTLLRHVQRRLEDDGENAVYANLEAARSTSQAIALIAASIDADNGNDFPAASDETDLGSIEKAAGDTATIVLVDGIDEHTTSTLFGRYRDRLWESPNLTWVVASRHRAPAAPADAFFDQHVALPNFTPAESDQFLQSRAPWIDEPDRRRIVEIVGDTQPLALMLLAQRFALTDNEPDALLRSLEDERRLTAELPHRLQILYQALTEIGPAHAGNDELLKRIGASRPWTATGLKELEDLGLAQTERDGRRMLYRAVRPALINTVHPGNKTPAP